MSYQVITALVDETAAEEAEVALALGGLAFERRDRSTLDKPPVGRVGLVVYGEPDESAPARVGALLAGANVAAEISAFVTDDESWRDSWKAWFKPRRIGRFVIVPSWERYAPEAGDVVLDLDPGRAFGTGGHASTRLCLALLDGLPAPRRFLDVGCGCGVLGIACAKHHPSSSGVAIDVDPEAVAVTLENAGQNAVADRIAASTAPVASLAEAFDLVFANIQAEVLIDLAPSLAARVAPGGALLASGILVEQADAVAAAFAARGLALAAVRDEEGWRALHLARGT